MKNNGLLFSANCYHLRNLLTSAKICVKLREIT